MFIPLAIGVLLGSAFSPLVNRRYVQMCERWGGKPPAEKRLIPMMVSCWLIPVGMFIFAWTSYPRIHWMGPAIGGFPVGVGFILLYNACNNYLGKQTQLLSTKLPLTCGNANGISTVDTYQHQAASALAAKTFLRSLWGASCVLFTTQMYHRLGYQWASSLLAFISLACCAIPYGFYYKGPAIRKHSKYAFADDEEQTPGAPLVEK